MEVRPQQAVDLLLRGGRHRPPALQHHTHAQEPLLPGQVGLQEDVREDVREEEGTPENCKSGKENSHKNLHKNSLLMSQQKKVRQASERDLKYQAIMRNLVRRYVTQEQRKAENEGVTEDDVNEIKNDISAFRFELIEIMRQAGWKVGTASGQLGTEPS